MTTNAPHVRRSALRLPDRARMLPWVCCCAALILAYLAIGWWPHRPLRSFQPESTAVFASDGALLRLTLASDQRYRFWVPLEQIPVSLQQAVLLHEDRWFRWHPGVNPPALIRAALRTYLLGQRRQGGSTLTMQLARLLGRLRTDHALGKAGQVLSALWLDARYSKDAILEAYLNLAPYGGNVEGVGAASLLYFGKHVGELSMPEQLTLAVLPQSPLRRMADAQHAQRINDALKGARDRLFQRLVETDPTQAAHTSVLQLPLAMRGLQKRPFAAPHLVQQLLAQTALQQRSGANTDSQVPSGTRHIDSLVQPRLQSILEQQTTEYLARRKHQGLRNASAILVDTRDMAVVAMLGSADFHDPQIHGQVNGTLARRSPGSTLKPFIYALAMDQGVLHPETVLRDVPTAFGPYAPENFDGTFDGPVTASEALTRSRNVPAVWAAAQLTRPTLYQFLRAAGIRELRSEAHYGLALVLGGGEVSMQELAGLYAMLRNSGRLQPLRWTRDQANSEGMPLLSPEAAFMTESMLRSRPRPDAIPGARASTRIAWKTGTSWGFRDAWTAGLVGPYVLVVWLGDFRGQGHRSLIGVDAAAPLFFQIADRILGEDPELRNYPMHPPRSLRRVEVCRASGGIPTVWCPRRTLTWFIPGKSPVKVDNVYRPLRLHREHGHVLCPGDPAPSEIRVFEFWPSELAEVYRAAGMPRKDPPQATGCLLASELSGIAARQPVIASPRRGVVYQLSTGADELTLHAHVDAEVKTLHWFVDGAYLGAAHAGQGLAWQPGQRGQFALRVVDDHGRSQQQSVSVELRVH